MTKKLRVTLIHSPNRRTEKHQACVRGLGLRRLHQTVELLDTPSIRGMINKVFYLVKVDSSGNA